MISSKSSKKNSYKSYEEFMQSSYSSLLLNIVNSSIKYDLNLKTYLLNTIGSSFLISKIKDSTASIVFRKEEIKELCHLVSRHILICLNLLL